MDTNKIIKYIQDNDMLSFYRSKEWKALRKAVLKRDHNECQFFCKDRGKLTTARTVHHKKEIKLFPDLALDLDNLAAICDTCHNDPRIHDRGNLSVAKPKKRKFINEERW